MKDFLAKIVKAIIEDDNFEIREEEIQGEKVFTILVPDEQIGRVVGKEGKIINSIRCLCRMKAGQGQQHLQVKVDKL